MSLVPKPTREDCLRGVETIIAMLRANLDVPLPVAWEGDDRITIYTNDRAVVARIVRVMGGGEKTYGSTYFAVERKYGPITFQVMSSRETVCRRIVTGYEDVPAREGYRRELVEWECEGSVLGWDQVLA